MLGVPRDLQGPRRREQKEHQPMNKKSMIAVGCMGFCAVFILALLWYGYPYHELQFFVEKTDIDQEHYTNKLQNMKMHPKYDHWMRRHNRVSNFNKSINSINNNYGVNPFNDGTTLIPIKNLKNKNGEELITPKSEQTTQDDIKQIFLQYLEPLCIKKNVLSPNINTQNKNKELPSDCNDLLLSMMNITTHHLFNQNEMNALSQRIEYLMSIRPQNGKKLFIHIPHTAITSLFTNIIKPNFKEEQIYHYNDDDDEDLKELLVRPKLDDLNGIDVVYGYLPFGFDKIFISKDDINDHNAKYVLSVEEMEDIENGNDEDGKLKDLWINKLNFTYYTILRDPIDFIIGNYYDGDNKEIYKDMDDFIDHKLNRNIQTKYICGDDLKTWYNPQSHHKTMNDFIVNGNEYMIARNNLISMGWIGLFEQLDESVKQLKWFWKLSQDYKSGNMKTEINKNFDKPFNVQLTVTQHDAIIKRNKWDLMLYDLAKVLYQQQQIVLKYMS